MEQLIHEKLEIENDFQDILHQQEDLTRQNNEAQEIIKELEGKTISLKIHGETSLKTLLETCIKSSKNLINKSIIDSELQTAIEAKHYFFVNAENLKNILIEFLIVYEKYYENNENVEGFARKSILMGNLASMIHIQGLLICNKLPNIEIADRKIKKLIYI